MRKSTRTKFKPVRYWIAEPRFPWPVPIELGLRDMLKPKLDMMVYLPEARFTDPEMESYLRTLVKDTFTPLDRRPIRFPVRNVDVH